MRCVYAMHRTHTAHTTTVRHTTRTSATAKHTELALPAAATRARQRGLLVLRREMHAQQRRPHLRNLSQRRVEAILVSQTRQAGGFTCENSSMETIIKSVSGVRSQNT